LVKNYGAVPTALLAYGVIPRLPGQCRTNLMGAIAGVGAADASDLVASSVLQVLDDRTGQTTAMIINMFDPDVIILGGRLAGLDRLYQNAPRK